MCVGFLKQSTLWITEYNQYLPSVWFLGENPIPKIADYIWWGSMEVFLLLPLYAIIDVAESYSNIVCSRSPSSSYHYGSTHIILFLSRFPFTTHHISYVRQGGLVVKSLKNQKSCLSLFREKSSYKHPIKKPRCFGKYPGWRNPSSTPPEKRVPKPPPETWWLRGSFWADLGRKKLTFSSSNGPRWFRGVSCYVLPLTTWKLTVDTPLGRFHFFWTPNYSP